MRWARRSLVAVRLVLVTGWFAVLLAAVLAAEPVQAQEPTTTAAPAAAADVLLPDVGSGFERGADEPGRLDSVTRTFSHPHGRLQLMAIPVQGGLDVRDIFDLFASASAPDMVPVDVPGVEPARWFVLDGSSPHRSPVTFLAFPSRRHVFTAVLDIDDSGELDPQAILLDVARRQIDRAGGPPDDGASRGDDPAAQALTAYLPIEPPARYQMSGSATAVGQDEIPASVGIDAEVASFLNERSHTVARVWANGDAGLSGAVGITEYPYGVFAAAALDAARDASSIEPVVLPGLVGIPDVFTFVGHGPKAGQVGSTLRRGRLSILVLAQTQDPAGTQAAADLVVDLTREVDRLVPAGATAPYRFPTPPSTIAGLAATAGLVTAAGASSIAIGRARARTLRGADRRPPPAGVDVVSLDADAHALRRRGAVVVVAQLVAVNVIIVALAGDFGWTGVVIAVLGLAGGLGFTSWWRRRELGAIGPAGAGAPFVFPRPAGAVLGIVALAVLALGVGYAFKGLRYLVLKPTLTQLGWSNRLHISPRAVGVVFALGGLVVAALGGALFRLARSFARADTHRLLAIDRREPILYLRSFGDDGVPLATIASARRPFFELFSFRGRDPFEEAVAWELATYGPVVAVGRPGRSLASLGAAREHLSDDTWKDQVARRMGEACAVAVATGETPGLHWEIAHIVSAGHLGKTLFVFPPVAPDAVARRWEFTAAALAAAGAAVDGLPADAAFVHTAHVGADGRVVVTVAGRRDEASYRTAVDRAMALIADAGLEPATAPAIEPAPSAALPPPLPPPS